MPSATPGRTPSVRVILVAGFVVAVLVAVLLAVVLTHNDKGAPRAHSSGSAGPSGSPIPTDSLPTPAPESPLPSFPSSGHRTAAEAALLKGRHGFGSYVTGGAGGAYTHVTTDADSGPGSLRDALAGNSPRWIVFDKNMTITLSKGIQVGSNKTIDGRGRRVEITAPNQYGLELFGVSNVIIESLTLHDFGDVSKTKSNNLPDAIHVERSKGVWIDHNDLSMAGDKLIAVQNGSSGVTVSWNHFHDQEQTFQIGNQTTGKADTVQTVTSDHNFFDRTGYRMPVASYGRVHVYNNYFYEWKTYAVRSERAAQMYLQNNVFRAGSNKRAALINAGGDGCNDARTRCDPRSGDLRASGNLMLAGATISKRYLKDANLVFAPDKLYKYSAQSATTTLASTIQKEAGPIT